MVIRLLGKPESTAYQRCLALIRKFGHAIDDGAYFYTDLAIGPFLTEKIPEDKFEAPIHGTLIFHPSPLPYGRGASSIKWAYKRREPITAATWFWATDKLDAGDICEMEIVKIDYSKSPREFYNDEILPAMERTLERCMLSIQSGHFRRVPQVEAYATFDLRL